MDSNDKSNQYNEQANILCDDETANEDIDNSKEKRVIVCRPFSLILCCISCAMLGAMTIITFVPNSLRMWLSGRGGVYEKIAYIDEIIDENYIYADQVDKQQMEDMLAWGYVYGLGDRYSTYYDAEQFTALQYSNSGGTYGIGISVALYEEKGGIYIVDVTPNSPAESAGIVKGDLITAVDGTKVTVENYNMIVDAIRGEIGTEVKLNLTRADGTEAVICAIRGEFTSAAVTGEMVGDVGYIVITTFNEATPLQFNDILDSHIANGATSLVIDLRGNTGGLVNAASEVLDRLLPECELGYAVYKDGTRKVLARSDADCVELPISVIIDANTASSSEYVAAALRDIAGAKLVGETSFGKGIMQTTYALGDGSAVRITVAEIYTAGGGRYHGIGLVPDVEASYTPEQAKTWFLLEGKDDPYISAAIECVK